MRFLDIDDSFFYNNLFKYIIIIIVGGRMKKFKKRVKDKIKLYSDDNHLENYIIREFSIEDGNAHIHIHLNSVDDLLDPRTKGNQVQLKNEIYEYFEEKSSMLDNDMKITFHINGVPITDKDEDLIKFLFREHYSIELYKSQHSYIEIRNKIIKLLILGIVCFIGYLFIFKSSSEFFLEVFGFIFSFSLWQAFEAMIYSLKDAKEEREAITQNLLTEIVFEQ